LLRSSLFSFVSSFYALFSRRTVLFRPNSRGERFRVTPRHRFPRGIFFARYTFGLSPALLLLQQRSSPFIPGPPADGRFFYVFPLFLLTIFFFFFPLHTGFFECSAYTFRSGRSLVLPCSSFLPRPLFFVSRVFLRYRVPPSSRVSGLQDFSILSLNGSRCVFLPCGPVPDDSLLRPYSAYPPFLLPPLDAFTLGLWNGHLLFFVCRAIRRPCFPDLDLGPLTDF